MSKLPVGGGSAQLPVSVLLSSPLFLSRLFVCSFGARITFLLNELKICCSIAAVDGKGWLSPRHTRKHTRRLMLRGRPGSQRPARGNAPSRAGAPGRGGLAVPPAPRPQPGCHLSVPHVFICSVRGVEKAFETVIFDHSNSRTETLHANRTAGPRLSHFCPLPQASSL